jgi:hypothetical protein
MAIDLIAVYQRHNSANPEDLRYLRELADRIAPGGERHFAVVDNRVANSFEHQLERDVTILSGDNRLREFSAYNRGIEWLALTQKPEPETVVLIANETYRTSYGDEYLREFTPERIAEALDAGGIYGHRDAYPHEVALLGMRFQSWIRSSLVVLAWKTLTQIGPFAPGVADAELFGDGMTDFFAPQAPLSENYRSYIRQWLFAETPEGSDFPYTWHSKTPLTRDNLPSMHAKARSILSEHRFSALAQTKRIPLLSYQ